MYLRNGRIGVLDLGAGEVSEQELIEGRNWDNFSSIKIAETLASEHGEDVVLLGTGVLTGSFVPAACVGIVRAKPISTGRPRIMPLLGFAGFELKLTGFDFIVLKGKAKVPGYVWIRDGIIEFVEATDLKSVNSWARTDRIRASQGDAKIQVIASGPWGNSGSRSSQAVVDYWGGEDKAGVASELAARNVLAVAFRGMGEIELSEPEKHFEDCILLMREHILRLGTSEGLASYFPELAKGGFSELVHRSVACYGCPFPCRTYLKTEEKPGEMRLVVKEPGYLHYDVPALSKAYELGLDARSASRVLSGCAKAGAEPVAVLTHCASLGKPVTLESVASVLSKPMDLEPAGAANFESSFTDRASYEACLGLGLCPRYWARVGFDFAAVSEYAVSALGQPVPAP